MQWDHGSPADSVNCLDTTVAIDPRYHHCATQFPAIPEPAKLLQERLRRHQVVQVAPQQLLTLLQPASHRFQNTDDELATMATAIRRMGHSVEGTPNIIASLLRARPTSN